MIVTGGKNVYCEEVESVIRGFPKIRDIVVIGLPDEKWGRKAQRGWRWKVIRRSFVWGTGCVLPCQNQQPQDSQIL